MFSTSLHSGSCHVDLKLLDSLIFPTSCKPFLVSWLQLDNCIGPPVICESCDSLIFPTSCKPFLVSWLQLDNCIGPPVICESCDMASLVYSAPKLSCNSISSMYLLIALCYNQSLFFLLHDSPNFVSI